MYLDTTLPVPGLPNKTIPYLSSFTFVFCLRAVSALALILRTCAFTSSKPVIFMRESMALFEVLSTRFCRSHSLSDGEGACSSWDPTSLESRTSSATPLFEVTVSPLQGTEVVWTFGGSFALTGDLDERPAKTLASSRSCFLCSKDCAISLDIWESTMVSLNVCISSSNLVNSAACSLCFCSRLCCRTNSSCNDFCWERFSFAHKRHEAGLLVWHLQDCTWPTGHFDWTKWLHSIFEWSNNWWHRRGQICTPHCNKTPLKVTQSAHNVEEKPCRAYHGSLHPPSGHWSKSLGQRKTDLRSWCRSHLTGNPS